MKSLFKYLILSLAALSLYAERSEAFQLRGIQKNNQGVQAYQKEQLTNSYDHFARSLGDLPFQPEVHYNLGRVFYENKEFGKSLQESLTAAKLAPEKSEARFLALFQAASALAQLKKVDDAIAMYQRALEIKPDSKETKTNIELLIAAGGQGQGEDQSDQSGGQPKDQPKDGEGDQPKDGPRTNQPPPNTPKPFKGEDLSKRDVENILDELKRQEEQIRAKFQREGAKDAPKDKDW